MNGSQRDKKGGGKRWMCMSVSQRDKKGEVKDRCV